MKSKSAKKRRRSKRLFRNNVKQPNHPGTLPGTAKLNEVPNADINAGTQAAAMWRGIYESFVFRQCEVQIEYWKQRAKELEAENEELRNQLRVNVPVYETSSEEDDEQQRYLEDDDEEYDDEDVSPEYLEFRSVTLKHREELRKQREAERMENNNDRSIAFVEN